MINTFKQEHNGVEYQHVVIKKPCYGCFALGDDKYILEGNADITTTKGSYKFKEELQFRIYNPKTKPFKKTRNASKNNYIEIFLGLEDGVKLLEETLKVIKGGGNMNNASLDAWDGFLGSNFLKAEMVKDNNHAFVCVNIEVVKDESDKDDAGTLRLTLESMPLKVLYDLNVTNARKLLGLGIAKPRDLIGKKIFFIKALARDPKKNTEVETLRISRIE